MRKDNSENKKVIYSKEEKPDCSWTIAAGNHQNKDFTDFLYPN